MTLPYDSNDLFNSYSIISLIIDILLFSKNYTKCFSYFNIAIELFK